MALYDRIGTGYDETRRADPGLVEGLCARLDPSPKGRYLDVGCGTGSYTSALATIAGSWTGIDPSERMLNAARERSSGVAWQQADAASLPFADASFNGAVCTLAHHHFPDRVAAFGEVRRVIGNGTFVSFACACELTQRYWLRHYFPRMFEVMAKAEPSSAELEADLKSAGFGSVVIEAWFVPDDLVDHFMFCGKRKPELYFDPAIRAGISTFANLATPEEMESGLRALRADLDSGRFAQIAAQHEHDDGDYVWIVAKS